ncbi:hypothetical protein GCM10010447_36430 [Streptomyces fulvorobeus]
MPAVAHSAGSRVLTELLTEPADAEDVGIEEAGDGANPKVTVLPSLRAHSAGRVE